MRRIGRPLFLQSTLRSFFRHNDHPRTTGSTRMSAFKYGTNFHCSTLLGLASSLCLFYGLSWAKCSLDDLEHPINPSKVLQDGWIYYRRAWYIIGKLSSKNATGENTNYALATQHCAKLNAHLPIVEDAARNKDLLALLKQTGTQQVWLGATVNSDGRFEWMDNSSTHFTNWQWWGITNIENKCVDFHTGRWGPNKAIAGAWSTIDCNTTTLQVMCQASAVIDIPDRHLWMYYANHWFYVGSYIDRVDYVTAMKKCRMLGSVMPDYGFGGASHALNLAYKLFIKIVAQDLWYYDSSLTSGRCGYLTDRYGSVLAKQSTSSCFTSKKRYICIKNSTVEQDFVAQNNTAFVESPNFLYLPETTNASFTVA